MGIQFPQGDAGVKKGDNDSFPGSQNVFIRTGQIIFFVKSINVFP
jgi:hypothetical protein